MSLPSAEVLFQPVTCMPDWVQRYEAIPNTTVSSGCSANAQGNVPCDPAAMARAAGQKIGRAVSLEAYTLARYITSEVGTRSVPERVAVAQAAVNRVTYTEPRVGNVLNLLLYRQAAGHPNRGFYGPIHSDSNLGASYGRWAATSRDPALSNIIIAIDVLNGTIPASFAKGADDQYGPEILVRKQGLDVTQNGVRRRGGERRYWVGPLPGVDHQRTFLYTTRKDVDPSSQMGQALIARGVAAIAAPRPNWTGLPVCAASWASKFGTGFGAWGIIVGALFLALGGVAFAKAFRRRSLGSGLGRGGLAAAVLPPGERRHVPKAIEGEIDDAVTRAGAAGADGALEYVGAGMEGIVFCQGSTAYKVGRRGVSLEDEADFLRKANTVHRIKDHVARFIRYDKRNHVLVRECVRGERLKWSQERKAYDLTDDIQKAMEPYGFLAPERKPDSWLMVRGRGPVLVDAGFATPVGHELVKHTLDVINERAPRGTYESNESLAFHIRQERDKTIPAPVANKILRRLYQTRENATKWSGRDEAERVFGTTDLGRTQPYTSEEFGERLQEAKERKAFFEKTSASIQEAADAIAAKGGGWNGSRKVFIADVAKRLGVPPDKIAGPLLIANNRGWLELTRADLTGAMDQDKVEQSEVIGPSGLDRYHFIVARSGALGVTARRGPRTGAIEVDPKDVERVVNNAVSAFAACSPDHPDKIKANYVRPPSLLRLGRVEVRDAATGENRRVSVDLSTRALARGALVHGRMSAEVAAPEGRLVAQRVTLQPKDACEHKETWRDELTQTLTHELAHAADPGIIKRAQARAMSTRRQQRSNIPEAGTEAAYRAYINDPVEVAANIAAVRADLDKARIDPDDAPDFILNWHSRRWGILKPALTEANKRKFYQMAARARDERFERRTKDDAETAARWAAEDAGVAGAARSRGFRRGAWVTLTRTYPVRLNDADSPKIERGARVQIVKVENSALYPGHRNYTITDGEHTIGPLPGSVLKARD